MPRRGGEVLWPGSPAAPATGLAPVTVGASGTVALGPEVLTSTSNSFIVTGDSATALRGAGDFVVTGGASNSTLTLGDGDQTVTLTGGGDTIAVGAGNSTIAVFGGGNTISTGAGMSFISVDGSAGDVIDLNPAAQGLTTISGFDMAADTLDIAGTMAGLAVAGDFSNLGSYLTATVAGGNTTLAIDPTGGGGSPIAFAVLDGVGTSVNALIAAKAFSLA